MSGLEVDHLSQKLLDVLTSSDYRPVSNAKDKITADKMEWLFEYDGFMEFFNYVANAVSEENVISADLLMRYDDLCQISPSDVLTSGDVLEVLSSLAKLSLQNAGSTGEDDSGLYPERILSSAGSQDLVKKEFTLLQKQAESLRRQSNFIQGQAQLERLSVVQKEDSLKAEQAETRKLEEQISNAASELDDVSAKLLAEVGQLGAFYASEQLVSGEIGSCGIMGALPFQDIYRMEEDYASKFTAYTRKQLGHTGVIHLTSNGAPVERPGRLSASGSNSGPLLSKSITSNGLDHIRNEELAACFKALTPARTSQKSNNQNKCLSFMRPGRLISAKFSSSRLSAANVENRGPDGRLSVDEMTVILQEIYADYGLALMERARSVVERDRLAGCVSFLEQFMASIERGELSNIIPNLEINLTRADRKYVDLKLKFDSAFLTGSSSIASSLDRLVSLSVESILDCGLDLELKRKEYVLDKREKIIGYLKAICARGLVVHLLLENELKSVTETARLGESVVGELKASEDLRLARKTFFSRSQFGLKQLPKYAVDSVNVFLTAFHMQLAKFPFPKESQLACCKDKTVEVLTLAHVAEHITHLIENLKSVDKSVNSTESAILQQTAMLTLLINQMRAVLSNDGMSSSPTTMLANLANRVNRETEVLEAQLTGEIRNVEEMKKQMADPLIREERLLFTKFFGDNADEASYLVNDIITDLQTKLAF